jgi:hypothetical protein
VKEKPTSLLVKKYLGFNGWANSMRNSKRKKPNYPIFPIISTAEASDATGYVGWLIS